MEYPFKRNAELFRWGPVPLKIYYADWAEGIFIDYPHMYPDYRWPKTLQILKGGRFAAVLDMAEVRMYGNKLFLEQMLPRETREAVRGRWRAALTDLQVLERKVEATDLATLSPEAFLLLWKRFHRGVDLFWTHAVLPELSNFASVEILQEALAPFVPEAERAHVMEALTAPEGISFYQEEEIALSETDDMQAHQKKYFWLNNSYDHVEVAPIAFFANRKKEVPANIRTEIEARIARVRETKHETQTKYALPDRVMEIAEAITDGIVWQDARKGDIWRYLHDKELLISEVARRTNIEKALLLTLLSKEIADILEGKEPAVAPEDRKIAVGMFMQTGSISIVPTEDALRFWDVYVEIPTSEDTKELKGTTASKGQGKVRGRVRIVLDPRDPGAFDAGDILVTSMTTPEFVFLMKRASAVVTDTGGLTSHAAIVSRELSKPCIIGTKVATQVLKDGDMVEVDADNGVVRVVERAAIA